MDEGDTVAEGLGEDFNELAGEGDFGDEKDGGFLVFEGICSQCEVDVGFSAACYAPEERSAFRGLLEASEGILLGAIERDGGGILVKKWLFCVRGA